MILTIVLQSFYAIDIYSTEELNDLEYRKVVLQGEFDHQREFYIMPRVPVDDDSHGGLMTAKGSKSGANIITAFKVADRE